MRSKNYYAAIDLGSNSFHMLVVRVVAGGVQVVSKIRRKVRLAAGLQADSSLDNPAKERALECLRIFADRVQDIDPTHIRAVGTATLRKVADDKAFIESAQKTLGHPIEIISGEDEAATIYQGVAHTTSFHQHMLVIDIGGASTEMVLGEGLEPSILNSLDMGCVTWYSRYFSDGAISEQNTHAAITAAKAIIAPVVDSYGSSGAGLVLGASGTFKALQEIASVRNTAAEFDLSWLYQLLNEAIACGHHSNLKIEGLKDSREPVFVSGLCILIALCESLSIARVQPTSGALREGIIYALLDQERQQTEDVQQHTLNTIAATYHLDITHAQRVFKLACNFSAQVQESWQLPEHCNDLMRGVAYLHELGLSLAYKHASAHASYMVQHLEMPGFNDSMRAQLVDLLSACAGIIDDESTPLLSTDPATRHLERLLRLAIILCQRRNDKSLVNYSLQVTEEGLHLQAPVGFFAENPFLSSLLESEAHIFSPSEQLIFAPRV